VEEVTASTGSWNVLVMAGSAAEEVAEFIVLAAELSGTFLIAGISIAFIGQSYASFGSLIA
jgi:hypothetical protein